MNQVESGVGKGPDVGPGYPAILVTVGMVAAVAMLFWCTVETMRFIAHFAAEAIYRFYSISF